MLTERGALDEAATQAAAALAAGPPVARVEGRVAACRLAALDHAVPEAPDLPAALATAVRSGHLASAAELALLRS